MKVYLKHFQKKLYNLNSKYLQHKLNTRHQQLYLSKGGGGGGGGGNLAKNIWSGFCMTKC